MADKSQTFGKIEFKDTGTEYHLIIDGVVVEVITYAGSVTFGAVAGTPTTNGYLRVSKVNGDKLSLKEDIGYGSVTLDASGLASVSGVTCDPNSVILLTPQDVPTGKLYAAPGVNSFDVHSSDVADEDLIVSWLLINKGS